MLQEFNKEGKEPETLIESDEFILLNAEQKSKRNPRLMTNELQEYWEKHYMVKGTAPNGVKMSRFCFLCGNTGTMDTTESAITPLGENIGRKNFCICPNGLALRAKDKNENN